MKLRHLAAVALMTMVMASCSKSPEPPPVAASAAEQPAAAPAEAPAAEPAAPEAGATAPAETPAVPAPVAAAASPAPSAPASGDKPAAPVGLTAGTDYKLISNGQPLESVAGKIEVAEAFNYACPACSGFNPFLRDWKKKLPADVNLIYVPADFRPDFVQYARAFYAADALGLVEKTHDAVYEGVHITHTLPGEGTAPDEARIAAFYTKYGANAAEFQQTMDGFAVNVKIAKGRKFIMQSQVTSTPSLIVNGRYLVKGKTWEDNLRIADALIAFERAR